MHSAGHDFRGAILFEADFELAGRDSHAPDGPNERAGVELHHNARAPRRQSEANRQRTGPRHVATRLELREAVSGNGYVYTGLLDL